MILSERRPERHATDESLRVRLRMIRAAALLFVNTWVHWIDPTGLRPVAKETRTEAASVAPTNWQAWVIWCSFRH